MVTASHDKMAKAISIFILTAIVALTAADSESINIKLYNYNEGATTDETVKLTDTIDELIKRKDQDAYSYYLNQVELNPEKTWADYGIKEGNTILVKLDATVEISFYNYDKGTEEDQVIKSKYSVEKVKKIRNESNLRYFQGQKEMSASKTLADYQFKNGDKILVRK